jgi:DNA-binding transcriptional LysR family regulator
MNIPIDGIQAFVQIAAQGSFRKAAEKLFISQTGLTRRIQRLEAFVGLKLLDRTTRSTTLTPVGREFLPLATRLVDDLTFGLDGLRTASRLSLGDVTVATLQSVAFRQLPLALRIYAERHPRNRVQLLERSGAFVTEAVREGQADFGIHIQGLAHPDLIEDLLMRDPFVLVCGENHDLAARTQMSWRDLADVDLITLGGASGNRRIVEEQLLRAGLEVRGRFVVESTPSAIALARGGVGVAILPASMHSARVATGLVEVPLVEPVVHRGIALVRRRNETMTPAAQALYEIVRSELSSPVKQPAQAASPAKPRPGRKQALRTERE